LLLLIAAQVSRSVRLVSQSLDRRTYCSLIGGERLPNGRKVIHVFRHHVQHVRKIHQRNKRRVETLRLCRIRERCPLQPLILLQPIRDIQNLLRIR
jgi:hypothetical protein